MPDEGGVTKMIKNLLKSFFILVTIFMVSNIYAHQAKAIDASDSCGVAYKGQTKVNPYFDLDDVKSKIADINTTEEKIKAFCKKFQSYLDNLKDEGREYGGEKDFDTDVYKQHFWWGGDEKEEDYLARFHKMIEGSPTLKKEYDALSSEYQKKSLDLEDAKADQLAEHERAVAAGEYQPCGSFYPRGCPEDMECYGASSAQTQGTGGGFKTATTSYTCKKTENVKKPLLGDKPKPVEQGTDTSTVVETTTGVLKATARTDETGKTTLEKSNEAFHEVQGNNSACSIPDMQKMYQSTCYSCKIIMTLITTFMNACAKVYDLTRDAGVKVLVIGSMLWLAAFALKLVSAFTNQEPMSILHTLFVFMFKVSAAYLVITIGIGVIVNLFINPLLMAGADYGLGLLQAANQGIIKIATTTNFPYTGTEIISTSVINKIMALTQGIDKTVSTNLVIGHALTCHSFNAGALTYTGKLFDVSVTIVIPDIWIWLCGAAIWFCGFMLTLGVGYYLLDVCFKIGFCIIALPIVIGLWPFGPTSSKFNSCMSIVFRSAGLFAFLALTVSYALSLISASLGDLTTFYAKIKAGDAEWVSNTFSITGSSFILIMFAYVYGIKMVGATVSDYVGKFFGDSVFGGASPMHMKATQITAMAKSKVTQAASFAGDVVTHQATRAAGAVAGGAVNFVKKQVKRGKSSGGNSGGGGNGGGNPPSGGASSSGSNGGSSGNGGSAGAAG